MAKIAYIEKGFRASSLDLIRVCNQIIAEYQAQGFDLTLRQLYYRLVARDVLPNRQKEYKRLGQIINDARLAGLVDWDVIVDRTRNLRGNAHWDSPQAIVKAAREQFMADRWATQPYRVEVWVEKDALVGVVGRICREMDVMYFSCRGYTSQSEMWRAAQRLKRYHHLGQRPYVIHLGDHDPSGLDMTRDIQDRFVVFWGDMIDVDRIALNWDQIEEYDPPPNPTKLTDSRARGYIAEYGWNNWELDALEPGVIADLIRETVDSLRDEDLWQAAIEREKRMLALLDDVVVFIERQNGAERDQ